MNNGRITGGTMDVEVFRWQPESRIGKRLRAEALSQPLPTYLTLQRAWNHTATLPKYVDEASLSGQFERWPCHCS